MQQIVSKGKVRLYPLPKRRELQTKRRVTKILAWIILLIMFAGAIGMIAYPFMLLSTYEARLIITALSPATAAVIIVGWICAMLFLHTIFLATPRCLKNETQENDSTK